MAEETRKQIILSINTDTSGLKAGINEVNGELDNLNNTQIDKPFKNLKADIKAANDEAQKMAKSFGVHSQQFTEAAKKVANLKDEFADYNKTVQAFNPDNKLQALVSLGRAAVGAVQGIAGAMTLLGAESEDVQKTIAKLQALMALSDALNSVDDIKNAFSNFSSVVKSSTVIQHLNNAANTAAGTIMKVLGITTNTTSTAFKGLKAAIVATGIGALIIGIIALVQNFDKLKVAMGGATKEQEAFNKASKEANKASAEAATKAIQTVNEVKNVFELAKKGVISKDEALKKYNDTLGDSLGKTNSLKTAEQLLADKADAYIQMTINKAKANVFFAKAAEAAAAGLTADTEDQTSWWDKAKVGTLNYFQAYGVGVAVAIDAQRKGVDEIKKSSSELEKMFNDAGAALLKKSNEDATAAGVKTPEQIALEDQQKKDREKALADAKARADKAAELLKSEREKLKSHTEAVQKITETAQRAIADSALNDREKELLAIETHFKDEDKQLKLLYDEQLTILKAQLKRKAITKAEYDKELLRIETVSTDASIALQEEKGEKNLQVEKKYNKIIADFIDGYQTNAYQESRNKLIAEFDEKIKVADEKQKELLEKLKQGEVGKLDQTETLRKNTINSETNLVTVQTENVIGDEDSPERKVEKLQAVWDAEKEWKEAKFQEELAKLGSDEEAKALLIAQYNQEKTDDERAQSDARKAIAEAEAEAKAAMLEKMSGLANQAADLIGKHTVAGKALAVAATTIDTFQSATAAFKGMVKAIPGPPGIVAGVAAAALSVAAGIANVKKILAVKVPAKGGAGGSSAGAAPSVSTAPVINAAQTSAATAAVQDVRVTNPQNQVIKAYITDRDLKDNEEKTSFLNKLSTI